MFEFQNKFVMGFISRNELNTDFKLSLCIKPFSIKDKDFCSWNEIILRWNSYEIIVISCLAQNLNKKTKNIYFPSSKEEKIFRF